MKKSLILASVVAAAAPTVAHADSLVGAQLQFMTGGEVEGEGPVDGDLETAYGLVLTAEYPVHPNFTVGLAPRLAFNIKLEDQDDGGIMIDVPLRGTGRFLVIPKLALYGFLSLGYSVIIPDDWSDDASYPSGFILGFGGGAAYQISGNLALVGEIGYTAGYHTFTADLPIVGDEEFDAEHSYPHVGIGVQTAF